MSQSQLQIKSTSILEDYAIDWSRKLGTGVNGPVYTCKDHSTNISYALKILKDNSQGHREVELHLRCKSHPHIVNIQDVYANSVMFPGDGHTTSALCVVMELMRGGELFDRISKAEKFTERNAACFTKQIALAVQRCHSLNIAHRDLKPENLLLKDDEEDAVIKLGDFGFAKVDDGSLRTPHFTPYYVAPQVLEARRKSQSKQLGVHQVHPYTYDKCCDMWSLGVIVYIMLCGYPPFCPTTPTNSLTPDMQQRIMSAKYEFSQADWSHISDQAKDVVERLLKVDPLERMTVNELLDHAWLRENQTVEFILNSPSIMLDKNMLLEAQETHSVQLTSMRLPERNIHLKSIATAENPLIRKRKQLSSNRDQPAAKKTPPNESETLKELLKYGTHLTEDGSTVAKETLFKLVSDACSQNPEFTGLKELLNGNATNFDQEDDLNKYLQELQNMLVPMEMDKT